MRQRNDTPHAWSFAATPATEDTPEQPPFVVEPGDTLDRPVLLDGWTAVTEAESEPAPADESAKTAIKTKRTAPAANDANKDGGEPR